MYFIQEVTNFVQSWLLEQDLRMYHAKTNTPAICRSNNLLQELGQVEYVFSDKTGTLTQNEMRLIACAVDGVRYGTVNPHEQPLPSHEIYSTNKRNGSASSNDSRPASKSTLLQIAGVANGLSRFISGSLPSWKKDKSSNTIKVPNKSSLSKDNRATNVNLASLMKLLHGALHPTQPRSNGSANS